MKTVHQQSTLFLVLSLLLVQCSAVTLPQPGEVFSDLLSSREPGPEMVVLPAGEFRMGCVSGLDCRNSERPVHRVTIGRPFAVSKYEVTFEDYDRFVDAAERASDYGWGRGRRPAITVSWLAAQEYVDWLSRETGRTYRLLSEAEWEYAARAGSTTRYSWGNEIGTNRANCKACGSPWDSRDQTAPVGTFPANAWGLHDMHGNVQEWVQDCWNQDYIGAPPDGSVWLQGDCSRRVVRGGSWLGGPPGRIGAASRHPWPEGLDDAQMVGFRVARELGR